MKNTFRTICLIIISCLLMGSTGATPFSIGGILEASPGEQPLPSASAQGPTDPAELETFLDALFKDQMETYQIAGLTFTLVKNGQIFLQKGYGYADLESQKPVDPDTTLFRLGSMTKLFTWTAVLQLAEQGKINLDADVNTYLDFKIPATFPEPVTLSHLMTHTAGFESLSFETKVNRYDQLQPLGQYLATHLPTRVRPVGQLSAYSNFGANLAGYIVERVSGMPFADYVETYILKPLSMDHTTARLPIPPGLASQLSSGYNNIQGTIQPAEFQIPVTQADCCISSSAADMGRFMMAHLNGGQAASGNGKILDSQTEKLMQTQKWAPVEGLPGLTYGFFEGVFNGQRILYHGGDIAPFHGLLVLIPEQNLGFFISYNTNSAAGLSDLSLTAFLDHYYPQDQAAAVVTNAVDSQANDLAGFYRPVRSSYTTLEKLNILDQMIAVKTSNDGAILIGSPFSSQNFRLVAVKPGLFRNLEYGVQIAFREDPVQKTTYYFDINQPGFSYEKLPWQGSPYLHYGLLVLSFLLFLSVILAAPAGFLLRRLKKGQPAAQQPLARASRWLAVVVAALDLLIIAAVWMLKTGSTWSSAIFYGQMSTINIILAGGLLSAVLSLVLIVLAVFAWKNHSWTAASRVHYSLVAIAALAFVWFLSYWNLLGFQY